MARRKNDNPTVAFISLGCVKNLVDSEKMLGLLAEDGMMPTSDSDHADVLVVNTCAFIDESKRESMDTLREAVEWKQAVPGRRVVVAGCMAQRYGKQVAAEVPEIDAMVGVFEREKVVQACRTALDKPIEEPVAPVRKSRVIPLPLRSNQEARTAETGESYAGWTTRSSVPERLPASAPSAKFRNRSAKGFWLGGDPAKVSGDLARMRLTPRHFAYLRISEGCDKRCTFCIIPHIRGDLVCKTPDLVIAEAKELVADGATELIVIGQNTTSYGKDFEGGAAAADGGIAGLLRRLARETDVQRLRLMYVYPANFYTNLIDVMAEEPKVLKYVDMPLQHINDRLLKAMKRGVGRKRIETLIRSLRDRVPGVVIRTTFIVGFPGETEAEFQELVAFVREHKFERVGVFTYSPEEGTEAGVMADQIPDDVKLRRREELMLAAQEVAFEHVGQAVGREMDVVIDGRTEAVPEFHKPKIATRRVSSRKAAEADWWVGRYYGQAPEVDSVVYVSDAHGPLEAGASVRCRVIAGAGYDLVAEQAV